MVVRDDTRHVNLFLFCGRLLETAPKLALLQVGDQNVFVELIAVVWILISSRSELLRWVSEALEEGVAVHISPGVARNVGFLVHQLVDFSGLILVDDAQSTIRVIDINAAIVHVEVPHVVSQGLELEPLLTLFARDGPLTLRGLGVFRDFNDTLEQVAVNEFVRVSFHY